MSINIAEEAAKADAGMASVRTVQEFDRVLEIFKVKNPDKFAAKVASGELERFRATLIGYQPPEPPKAKDLDEMNKTELVALAESKGVKLGGTETKAEIVELLKDK